MKQLQNDFTTPEQSKRLLELGVPANSSNLWYEKDESVYDENLGWIHGAAWSKVPSHYNWDKVENRYYTYDELKKITEEFTGNETLPCWSVGRLIEIFSKCYTGAKCYYSPRNLYKTEFWIERFDRLTMICFIDFSKLED